MKNFALTTLLTLFAALTLSAQTESPTDFFHRANALAAEANFAEAIPLYETAAAQRPSANLHYNLGLAYRETADHGRARLHWEKALAMEPGHTAARQSLESLLREQNLESLRDTPAARVASLLPLNQWIWLAASAFWIALFALLLSRWKSARWALPIAAASAVILLLSLTATLLASPSFDHAIVIENNTALQIAPTPASPIAQNIRPGQPVRILETHNTFARVRLPNATEGYLPTTHISPIRHP